ncbi:MAG: hypothetical protein ABSG65_17855 [Bryobacteraceae bacterium]|jgi:hypothetical protein
MIVQLKQAVEVACSGHKTRHMCVRTALAVVLALTSTAALLGQRVEKEGKAWLATRSEPAGINVNGSWHAGSWGMITLNQPQGSREVTGKSEDHDISGVVSGDHAYLLFINNGHVYYSADLSQDGPNTLAGQYADGLSWKSGTRMMHLSRDAQESPNAEAQASQAYVVVYRVKYKPFHFKTGGIIIKPSVYCDDREVAFMYSGRYFTIAVPAGKHSLSSSSQYKFLSLKAQPGATYYVRIALTNDDAIRPWFGVEQVDADTALKELRHLKAADARHITKPEMVSTALPAQQ